MKILKWEENFSKNFIEVSDELNKLFENITKAGKIDLDNNEISKAILLRLKYYYKHQDGIKIF